MAVTKVGTDTPSETPNNTVNTSLVVTHPSTPQIGDYVAIEACLIAYGTGTSNDFDTPANWVLVGTSFDAGSPSHRMSVFGKVWEAGDTLPTLTWPNPSQALAVTKIRRGVDQSTPVHRSSVAVHGGTGVARTTNSITTTTDCVIEYAFSDRNGSSYTPGTPSDSVAAYVVHASALSLASYSIPGVSSANSYVRTATATASTSIGGSAIYALKPAGQTAPIVTLPEDFSVNPNTTSSFDIQATAVDFDGTIVSYLWEDITTGTPVTLADTDDTLTVSVTLPQAGQIRTYRCTVTDDSQLTASDTVTVTFLTSNYEDIIRVGTDAVLKTANNQANTSLQLTHGSIPELYDHVIIEACLMDNGGTGNDFDTPPNWTLLGTVLESGTPIFRLSVFEKVWTMEDTLPTLTWPNPSQAIAVVKIRRGVDLVAPIHQVSISPHGGTGMARTTGTIVTTIDSVIEYAFGDRSGSVFTKDTVTDDTLAVGLNASALSLSSFAIPGIKAAGSYVRTVTSDKNTAIGGSAIYALKPNSTNYPPTLTLDDDFEVDPNLVDSFDLVALATAHGATIVSYLWEDVTGTPVTIPGSGSNRTIDISRSTQSSVKTYRCTVTDNNNSSRSDEVVVTILPHTRWFKTSSSLVALRRNV